MMSVSYPITGQSQEEILIGVAGPMTGSIAAFGEQLRYGAEQAVADINARGGILGKKLRLVIGDDVCDPKQAVAVANDMVKRKVVFVAGHFCSSSSIPASAVYAAEGILQITPASTNILLTDDAAKKGWTTVMRTCGRDDKQGDFAGRWLAQTYPGKNVAILHDKSAYGKGLADETKKNMNAAGLREKMFEAYNANERDFSALISKMKRDKIEIVYVGGYHNDIGLLARQATEQGLKIMIVGGDALNSSDFWAISGAAGEGTRFSDSSSALNLPAAKPIVEKFRSQGYEPEGYTLSSYAAIQAWAAGVVKANSFDGKKVAAALRGMNVETVIGTLNWDQKGDLKNPVYAWFVWSKGKFAQEVKK
ncbi:MAG: branched-chain amino acid ABC transporter substrate-binding protein [Rhodospirillaceae bacterium]|nr:branched-chain amino acid ABC transporter substrate-binding protein [Rhodospirillaceae bacterium]